MTKFIQTHQRYPTFLEETGVLTSKLLGGWSIQKVCSLKISNFWPPSPLVHPWSFYMHLPPSMFVCFSKLPPPLILVSLESEYWMLLFPFSRKKVPFILFNTLPIDQVLISDLLSPFRYQAKCAFKFLFGQFVTWKTLRFNFIIFSSNGWYGEKEGKREIQKFEYIENEKSFSDEIKSIFHIFKELSFGEKKKNNRHKL